MGADTTKSAYRRDYEFHIGVRLPKEIHVHHIDHDKDNNYFSNLVAIPRQLHGRYHFLERDLKSKSDILRYNRPQGRAFDRFNYRDYQSGNWRFKFKGTEDKYLRKIHILNCISLHYDMYDEAKDKYVAVRKEVLAYKKQQIKLARNAKY